jgi:serine/threonine-protein kinase
MAEAAQDPDDPTAEQATSSADSADEEIPTRIGRYQVDRKLGSGGMADAYLCRQTGMGGFDRQVVVKRIRPHLLDRDDVIFMFLDEARIISQLSHPNVVQIYDIDEQDGLPYLVMEYVRGLSFETLSRRLSQRGVEYPIDLVAALGEQACAGLHAAHDLRDSSGAPLGVVHRDVSPSNLLLSIDGVVKIIDFGVARAKNRLSVTSAGHLKGRAGYVAPEALTDTVIDRRADVFALGVVLYELCTGKTLFDHNTDVARLSAVLTTKTKPLNQVRGDAEIGMTEVLKLALAIDPRQRHESAAAFGAALHAVAMRSGRFVTPTLVGDWLEQHVPDDVRSLGRHLTPRPVAPSPSAERTQSQPSPFSTTVAAPVAPSSGPTAMPAASSAGPPSSVSPVSSMATNLQLPLPTALPPMIDGLSQQVRAVTPMVSELAAQVRQITPVVGDLAQQVRLMRRLYWPLVTLFWLFGLGLILLGVWMLLQSAHR